MNQAVNFIENNLWHTKCPACESQFIRELGKQSLKKLELYSSSAIVQSQRPEIWTCLTCKSMFKQNSVNEADSVMLYSEGNAISRWSGDTAKTGKTFLSKKTAAVRKCLENILLKSQNVLDIGCNDGSFLDDARSFGLKTSGVEYSCEARSFCSAKEHKVFSSLDEVVSSFDLITAFDLVEHLYDISSFLAKCKDLLAPGGRIVIITGAPECLMARAAHQNWWYTSFPEHIVFPSLRYFSMADGLFLEDYFRVRHSRQGFKFPIRLVRALMSIGYNRKFDGLSGLWSDHNVVVLSPIPKKQIYY
jgi:SAM-dependent methyltransferase